MRKLAYNAISMANGARGKQHLAMRSQFRFECQPNDALAQKVSEQVFADAPEHLPLVSSDPAKMGLAEPLHLFGRLPSGELVAGLLGFVWKGRRRLQVDVLWVADEYRTEGFGGGLLNWAEDEARLLGCTSAKVYKRSFNVPGFYRKWGYHSPQVLDMPFGDDDYLYKLL